MKKLFVFFLAITMAFAASSQVRRTNETTGSDDTNPNRVQENTIDSKWGSATDRIQFVTLPNKAVVIMVPVYKGNKVQGWDVVIMAPDGKTVAFKKSRQKGKFADVFERSVSQYYAGGGSGSISVDGYGAGEPILQGILRRILGG